jgi:hypothetical protein
MTPLMMHIMTAIKARPPIETTIMKKMSTAENKRDKQMSVY